MICARCDQPIEGEPMRVVVESGTSVAGVVYVCPTLCRPVPRQTYPTRS